MSRLSRFALLLALIATAGATPGRAAEIPPLGEKDLATFLAVQKTLVADADRAAEFCSIDLSNSDDGDLPPDPEGARIGRELDAHPYFGPILRRHAISGQRFAQVAVQVAASALGLAMADSFDDSARTKGEPATNRASLLSKSPDTRLVAAHLAEITALLEAAGDLCGEVRDSGDRGDRGDAENEGDER